MLVRAHPQFLRAGARLDVLKCGDDAGLENVEPAGQVKTGYVDRAPEIVPIAEIVRRWMPDDLVEKRLPGDEIRILGERQVRSGNSGIVDQNVRRPEAGLGRLDGPGDAARVLTSTMS